MFRKTYTRKEWEKKIRKHVYLPKEREFLESLIREEPAGRVRIVEEGELSKENLERLVRLAKEIKANRGVVSLPKLGILLVCVGLLTGTYYFLRNRLVAQAITAALEGVFRARAEVEGVSFEPFEGRISWKRLSVADRDRPMRNLFELGTSTADLDMAALLRGRILIEELRAERIQWNTERKTSGALPEAEQPEATGSGVGKAVEQVVKGSEAALQSLAIKGLNALQGIDVEKMAKEQVENLETTRLLKEAEKSWKEKEQGLRASIQNLGGELEKIGAEANSFRTVDLRTLTNPEEILKTVQRAEALIPRVKQVRDTATILEREARQGVEALKLLQKNLEEAVRKDTSYVESLVSLAPSEAASLAELFFTSYAKEQLGKWYGYGEKALRLAERLTREESDEKKPSKTVIPRSPGRDIPFPGPALIPRFTLRYASISVGKDPSSSPFTGELRDLSSNPDLIGKPATWKVHWESPNPGKIDLEGRMDLRKESRTSLEVSGRLEGFPVKVEPGIFGVQWLEGKMRSELSVMFPKAGGMEGKVVARLQELTSHTTRMADSTGSGGQKSTAGSAQTALPSAPARMLQDLVHRVLTETKELDATADVRVSPTGKAEVTIRSVIDRTVKSALEAYLREEEKRLKELAREELKKQLSSYLSKHETLRKGWEELDKSLGGKVTDASAYQKLVEDKKKEGEQRIEALKKEAADRLLQEAQKLVPELPKELPMELPKEIPKELPKAPSLPKEVPKDLPRTPSLPTTPGLPKTPSLPKPGR